MVYVCHCGQYITSVFGDDVHSVLIAKCNWLLRATWLWRCWLLWRGLLACLLVLNKINFGVDVHYQIAATFTFACLWWWCCWWCCCCSVWIIQLWMLLSLSLSRCIGGILSVLARLASPRLALPGWVVFDYRRSLSKVLELVWIILLFVDCFYVYVLDAFVFPWGSFVRYLKPFGKHMFLSNATNKHILFLILLFPQ